MSAHALRGGGVQGTGRHRTRNGGENGPGVSERSPSLGTEEIVRLLAAAAALPLSPGAAVSQLDHALQTAALLRHRYPDDPELAVAGLVHDVGHLLPGVGDAAHAPAGAVAVRAVLGARVAGLVALHVEAKRYLVATEPGYGGELAARQRGVAGGPGWRCLARGGGRVRSPAPGGRGGGPAAGRRRREVEGLAVGDLGSWVPLVRGLSERGAGAGR